MNTEKMTKSVVLFILSFPYLLFQSICYHAHERGFHSDIGAMILFTGLIYLFLPLTGLFAVSDYKKTSSPLIKIVHYGRIIFLGTLALNVLHSLVILILPSIAESIVVEIIDESFPILDDDRIFEILLAAPYFVSSILQLLVWLILLIRTRSLIFGFGLATFVILTVSSLDSLMYWFEAGASI
jgi:hypothetical protein